MKPSDNTITKISTVLGDHTVTVTDDAVTFEYNSAIGSIMLTEVFNLVKAEDNTLAIIVHIKDETHLNITIT